MIRELQFKNYKLFRRWQKLSIKPINIIIGKNNSGKSSVVRLPILIANALNGNTINPSLIKGSNLNETVTLGNTFEDLQYNKIKINAIEFKIKNENEKLEIQFIKDWILDLKINDIQINSGPSKVSLKFENFPFRSLSLNYDFIGAFRVLPQIDYNIEESNNDSKIGVTGKNAYQLLIKDFIDQNKVGEDDNSLYFQTSQWFKANFNNWKLVIEENKTRSQVSYEFGLSNNDITFVNLNNTGQGIHQTLPIIVKSFIDEKEPILNIIEEPETHLHPSAHGNLAERIVDSYLNNHNISYLIETHSQNFILRIRRMIAEGKLSAEDFGLYFVEFNESLKESTLRTIEIGEKGEVKNNDWPRGMFEETALETRRIYSVQVNN